MKTMEFVVSGVKKAQEAMIRVEKEMQDKLEEVKARPQSRYDAVNVFIRW